MTWYEPCAGLEMLVLSAAPNEPESAETELPSGRTIVMMRSAAPVNVTVAVARTETFVYVPAGTRMLTMWASGESAPPEQSLPGLAPGRTVPVQVTLVDWPWIVGTVTWSAASDLGTMTAASSTPNTSTEPARRPNT